VLTTRMLCHPNAPLEFQQHAVPGRNAHPEDRAVRDIFCSSAVSLSRSCSMWVQPCSPVSHICPAERGGHLTVCDLRVDDRSLRRLSIPYLGMTCSI
jgi:hypothetical protein